MICPSCDKAVISRNTTECDDCPAVVCSDCINTDSDKGIEYNRCGNCHEENLAVKSWLKEAGERLSKEVDMECELTIKEPPKQISPCNLVSRINRKFGQ